MSFATLISLLALMAQDPAGRRGGNQDTTGDTILQPPPKPEGPQGRPLPLPDAGATVSVLLREELNLLGPLFVVDVLRVEPGMEVQRLSSTESAISLRGYNDDSSASQGLLVIIDGRQRNNDFFGSVIWEGLELTLDDIERLEVIRGPGSFLHGPNAMHGYVNVSTRSPLSFTKSEVLLHGFAGSYGSNLQSFTIVHRHARSALKLRAAHDDIDEFDPRHRNGKDKVFADARFEGELGETEHRIDLAAGASSQKFNVLIPAFSVLGTAEFAGDAEEVFARMDYRFKSLRLRASGTRFDAEALPDRIYVPFHVLNDTADLDSQLTLPEVLGNTLTAGAGWRYSTFDTENQDVAGGRHHTQVRSTFLQDEILLAPLKVTGGLRVDDHSVAGTTWSPRAAAVWTLDPVDAQEKDYTGHTVRFTYGTGFRNPSLRELWFDMLTDSGRMIDVGTGVFHPLLVQIDGNLDVAPEKMRSLELGYWGRPEPWLQVQTNVYFNLIDRLIGFVDTGATVANPFDPAVPVIVSAHPENGGKEEAYGVEAQVQVQMTHEVFAFASYSYGIRRDRDTEERNPGAPMHKAAAGLRYSGQDPRAEGFGGMLWATFMDDVEFIDPGNGASLGKVDAYALLNGQVYYKFKLGTPEGKAFVQAFNLLDHDHREHPQGDEYGLLLMGGFDLAW